MTTESRAEGRVGPPVTQVGVLGWLRENLFSNLWNSLLTLISGALLYVVGRVIIVWSVEQANWRVIPANIKVILTGRYPAEGVWRLSVAAAVILVLSLASLILWKARSRPETRRWLITGWVLSPFFLALMIRGFHIPIPATVSNNLGYYLYRPELLPALGEVWRAYLTLFTLGLLVALTWRVSDRRWLRAGAAIVLGLFGLLLLPLGLEFTTTGGLPLPYLVPLALACLVGFLAFRLVGGQLAGLEWPSTSLVILWGIAGLFLILVLTFFNVGSEQVDPEEVLPIVRPDLWGGILLTLLLTVVSIVASFPIGVLLALGRRSQLPVVKGFSILFIELVRGVPLITILFMAQVMFPLFLPLEITLDRVLRAMVGMTLFTAAYLAEIVRGGLQAVQEEQIEAARALGLSELLVTVLVVLPQALRTVIPPIMGQFVSIFKDTTLVTIVGLLDLLGVLESIIKQREFSGTVREVYVFAAVFYFVLSFAMSYASRRLERRLGVGD